MERQSLKEELKGMMLAGEFNSKTDEKLYFFVEETLKYEFWKIGILEQDRGEIINGVWLKLKENRKMEEIAEKTDIEDEIKINLLISIIKYYAINYNNRVIRKDKIRVTGKDKKIVIGIVSECSELEYSEVNSEGSFFAKPKEEGSGEIIEAIEQKIQLKKFSKKEKEQYYLIVQGYDNKEIAEKMNISYAASRKTKERLIKKLREEYGVV